MADEEGGHKSQYKCKTCGQIKKGHTCPVTATLKEELWGSTMTAGAIPMRPPEAVYGVGGDGGGGSRGGGDSGGVYSGGWTTAPGSRPARMVLTRKLLERLERRLVQLPTATIPPQQNTHQEQYKIHTSVSVQPTGEQLAGAQVPPAPISLVAGRVEAHLQAHLPISHGDWRASDALSR